MLTANPHIANMAPYALADLNVPAGTSLISLAQNESLRPPSPRAIAAAKSAMEGTALYPDPDWTDLRNAISQEHGLTPDTVLCGAGSMELIGALMRAYAGPGDQILASEYSYAFFSTMAQLTCANYVTATETGFHVSVKALLGAVTERTKIVCIANPGNPTGTFISASETRKLRAELPMDVLLIIDEAYGEFAIASDPLFDLANVSNTVILRTFSKAYGLAGMRVGWGVFPHHIGCETRKLLNPNNVSAASQAAATAAMADAGYMRDTCTQTARLRDKFSTACQTLGLQVPQSHTNFVLIRFGTQTRANRADQALRSRGVLMRGMGGYGLADCLRATIGPAPDMDIAIETLTDWHRQETHP